MAVYDLNGNELSHVYDLNGNELDYAYDLNGNIIYQRVVPEPVTIKVMTYNVGQWYIGSGATVPTADAEAYYNLQNGIIQSANADILFINEYRELLSESGNVSALDMLSQYYPYIISQNGTTNYQNRAICSKYPLSNYVKDTESYYCDTATVTIGSKEITVGVLHLSTDETAKITKLNKIIQKYIDTKNFIAGGDFNLSIQSTSSDDYVNGALPILANGFNSANWSEFGLLTTYSNVPEGSWTGCLDSIITSSDLTIDSAYVDTTKQTDSIADKIDHMPLIATITIPS